MAQQPLIGQGLLIFDASWSQSDTPHSVGLLWTSDQPDSETSTWQHTHTQRQASMPRGDSNPQSHQASCCRPIPQTARSLGPAKKWYVHRNIVRIKSVQVSTEIQYYLTLYLLNTHSKYENLWEDIYAYTKEYNVLGRVLIDINVNECLLETT
jgi:hypothetical protein